MAVIVSIGEALVEIMRPKRGQPLDRPAEFSGPYASGAPAIFASAAARLGALVGFGGTVGADAFGECILNHLLADGVDCSALRRVEGLLTGIAFVAYAMDGSRSFVFHLPQSAAALMAEGQFPPGYWEGTRYLHVMGSSLSISDTMRDACYRAAEVVRAGGGTVSLDPNLRPELMPLDRIRSVCEPILEAADLVLPSGEELTMLTGALTPEGGASLLIDMGVEIVALKRGANGSSVYTEDGVTDVPSFKVEEVDPTGAGDCFDAAFVVGLSEGWPLETVALFANAAGALATTRLGPMEGTFSREHVWEFMASQGRPFPEDCKAHHVPAGDAT